MQIQELITTATRFVKANSQLILTGFAVAGVATTAVLTARATVEAYVEYSNESSMFSDPFTKREVVKLVWRHYIAPVGVGLATVGCIIGAQAVGQRRQAMLVSAYSLAQKGFEEYQAKVVEVVGEKKESSVRDAVAQDRIAENPVSQNLVIVTGNGDTLVYDSLSGRYFKSDVESLRKAQNDANAELFNDTMLTLNRYYSLIGLGTIDLGEEMGWLPEEPLDINFSARLTEENKPCLVLDHRVPPRLLSRGY